MTSVPRIYPTHLTAADQALLDKQVHEIRESVFDAIPPLLLRIPDERLQQLVYETAFKANAVVPKRQERLPLQVTILTDAVYRGLTGSTEHRERLTQFAIAVQEYYDLLDDVIDGDVKPGELAKVVLVSQLLMPSTVEILAELGEAASKYWSRRAIGLATSVFLEKMQPKSLRAYEAALEAQAWYFGICTGLAALVAGAEANVVERAEETGKRSYLYGQLLLDLYQEDEEDNWNILHFMARNQALDVLETHRKALVAGLDYLAPAQATLLANRHSLDLTALRNTSS